MGIPVSLLLIGVGAILTWAVQDRSRAINLDAVGIILMIVGAFGLLLSLVWWDRFGLGYWRRDYAAGAAAPGYGRRARRVVVEDEAAAPPAAPPVAPGPPAPPPAPPPDY